MSKPVVSSLLQIAQEFARREQERQSVFLHFTWWRSLGNHLSKGMFSLTFFLWVLSFFHCLNAQHGNQRRGWWTHLTRFRPVEEDFIKDVNYVPPPRFSMVAPARLRVGIKENIVVEASGVSEAVLVSVSVFDSLRSQRLWQGSVTLSLDNDYFAVQSLEINPSLLSPETNQPKSVHVIAQFGTFHQANQIIQVSFLSGYIFIQTDKPIYNPGDTVRCRAFVSTPDFQAFNGTISLEIQNPDEITVYTTSRTRVQDGIYSDSYVLSDMVKEGKWKIVAKFNHWTESIFNAEFEVKKYVLPAFNVTLIPKKSHFSLEDDQLEVEVFAKYMYGVQVEGVAYVVFGVERNGEKSRFPHMKQVKNLNGGTVTLTREEIKKVYPNIRDLLGFSVYIKVSVLTSSGSDLVEAEKSGIKIVLAPYVISFKDPLMFYKPGLPFDLTVKVSHHDGSPVPNVPIRISHMQDLITEHKGTIKVSINMPSDLVLQTLTVQTVIPDVKAEQQAVKNLNLEPYLASNIRRPKYLYISVDRSAAKVGEVLSFKLYIRTSTPEERDRIQHVLYVVLNKGKIIHAGKVSIAGQELTSISLLVSEEMLPVFRFVAYYHYVSQRVFRAEVVADSVLVDIGSQCVGSLSVVPEAGQVSDTYLPGDSFHFQVKGDAGARVGLVAVDNRIFLLSGSRLTQGKIWETVGRGDMGCSPGGGKDSMGVFKDAGLIFQSNSGVSTDSSQGFPCFWKPRTRRSAYQIHLRAQLEKRFSDRAQQRCCMDGMRDIPMPYSCRRRSLYITDGWDCTLAFLRCCSEYRGEVLGVITPPPPTTAEPTTTPSPTEAEIDYYLEVDSLLREASLPGLPGLRNGMRPATNRRMHLGLGQPVVTQKEEVEYDEEEYVEADDIYIRTKFFESWLWTDVRLPGGGEPGTKDRLAVSPVHSVLPDSITQWGILAISASPQTGFCVAEPFNVRVWKRFFVDLRLPRTAARNEHVEVKAVLHNYMNEDLQVLVILHRTEDMCSVAFTGDHKQEVAVRARSSLLLRYTVVPLRAGELPLQVTAMARYFSGQDAIRKTLRVVVEGIQTMDVRSYVLNPTEKGNSDGKQVINVGKAKLSSVVPNSLPETFVNVRGDLLADSIENSINKDSLSALIRMPGGCVEQNLASITLPLIAAHYLDRSDQWDSVGRHRQGEALAYIQKGYEKQLHYCKKDDSYPPYQNEGTSTWITAYVVKVFAMAHHFIGVNKKHVCGPVLHLLRHKQLSSGAFKEDNPVYTTSMTGGLQGAESKETLTAFVLIALAEAQKSVTCDDPEINTESRFRRAGEYLKERYPQLKRPYSVAIACYALAVSNQGCQKSVLLKAASPDRTHWLDSSNQFFTLEATGYALLALLQGGHTQEAAAPFKWLNQQRRVGGGYGSTQSTMVVLQALSEYLVKKPPSDQNLQVELSVPGRSDKRWDFNRLLAHVARSARVPLDQDFTVMASGHGQGILEVVTVYNQLPDMYEQSSCNGFELDVSISKSSEKPPPDVEKSYTLNITVRALEKHHVRMAVLDITLPTGFEPESSDLELLRNSVDRYINHFQVVDNLSDRGSLIIHLFKVSNRETDMVSFRLHQRFKVGLLQPSTVTVYQYYNEDKRCSKFYTPPEDKEELSQICTDNICRCTQGNCCVMKTDTQSITAQDRTKVACSGLHHALKVRVQSLNMSQYDRYEMEILQVIKEGIEVGMKHKDTRVFLSHASCREGLNLLEGQDYLIIGPSSDAWSAGSAPDRYTFTLGRETWVESWPSQTQCEQQPTAHTCAELETFTTHLLNTGCQN